jgi:hypothetical protein
MVELNSHDQHTYDAVLRHPTSGNIEWKGLISLCRHLGDVVDEPNGKFKFTRNGHSVTLEPHSKDVDKEIITHLRSFLRSTDIPNLSSKDPLQVLLVIDHAEARVYRSEAPDSKAVHIEPGDPRGWNRHVHTHHSYARPPASEPHHEFYKEVICALAGAEQVLVFCAGSGSSHESDYLLQELYRLDPVLSEHVIDVKKLDLSHMTEGEILEKAREIFST